DASSRPPPRLHPRAHARARTGPPRMPMPRSATRYCRGLHSSYCCGRMECARCRGWPPDAAARPCSRFARTANRLRLDQQRASAARRSTPTRIGFARALADASRYRQTIIVSELLTGMNGAPCLDKNRAVGVLDRFAVRRAAVVDPARGIAADRGIDDATVGERKKERVGRVVRL